MKILFSLFLSLMIPAGISAKTNKKKIVSSGEHKLRAYSCAQKSLPLSVQYQVYSDSVAVELKTEAALKAYQIKSARGVDGLKVLDFQKIAAKDVPLEFKDELEYQITKPEGRSFFVLEVQALVAGKKRLQIISIPIGELSDKQKNKDRENIVDVDMSVSTGPLSLSSDENVKIHRMRLKKKK
jgi:hypothetical protein